MPKLEDNPQSLWKCIHKSYRRDFFEEAVFKHYEELFAVYKPEFIKTQQNDIEKAMTLEIMEFKKEADAAIETEREETKKWKRMSGTLSFELASLKEEITHSQQEELSEMVTETLKEGRLQLDQQREVLYGELQ